MAVVLTMVDYKNINMKSLLVYFVVVVGVLARGEFDLLIEHGLTAIPEDAKLEPDQLCEKYGYPYEVHHVTTEDGYILEMWRVKHGASGNGDANAKPIFLNHGLLACASTFMAHLPRYALYSFLADNGYDVWLGNNRGNTFSRNHIHLKPDDPKFWDFDFESMALYDIKAQLGYVKEVTGVDKVPYIGHSQGTEQMFLALAEIEDTIADVALCFGALAPVASLGHILSSTIKNVAKLHLDLVLSGLHVNEVLPHNWFISGVEEYVCGYLPVICEDVIWALFDLVPLADDMERTAVSYHYYPAGTSLKNLVHYEQAVNSGKFAKYDYGKKENMKRYGQETAPEFDLTKISKVPIGLFIGGEDELADPEDVAWLKEQLPASSIIFEKTYPDFGHSTFNIGKESELEPFLDDVLVFLDKCYAQKTTTTTTTE